MCGIVAYNGNAPALPTLFSGLSQLEYRGYDSAGVALPVPGAHQLFVYRAAGRVDSLSASVPADELTAARTGVAHTRWATHDPPTTANAHPHRDCHGNVAVVHNGTIDNATRLRAELSAAGHRCATGVDTEVVAHLIEDELAAAPGELVGAVAAAVRRLEGSWALAVAAGGEQRVVLARNRSPLLVGTTEDGLIAASDTAAFDASVSAARELSDGDVVEMGRHTQWFDRDGAPQPGPPPLSKAFTREIAELGDAPDFTLKEIAEQPVVAKQLIDRFSGWLAKGRLLTDLGLPTPERVRFIACGSSRYAAQVSARMLETLGGIPAQVVTASEHAGRITEPGTLTVAVSQSGETADVLTAMESKRGPWLAVTNAPESTLARRADAVLDLGCGPERAVAATKSFTAQVIAGAVLALALSAAHNRVDRQTMSQLESLLGGVPGRLEATDSFAGPAARTVAARFAGELGWLYTSRGAGLPYAAEGALKLEEVAYRWVAPLPAGELKHGPIALIERGSPVVVVEAEPATRLEVNVAEMTARGAHVLPVGPADDAALPTVAPPYEAPWGPVEAVVALQHMAREAALTLGHEVDRPRNLAKSVTVE